MSGNFSTKKREAMEVFNSCGIILKLTSKLPISAAVWSNFSGERETNRMLNFNFANCKANSLPIPFVAPVTTMKQWIWFLWNYEHARFAWELAGKRIAIGREFLQLNIKPGSGKLRVAKIGIWKAVKQLEQSRKELKTKHDKCDIWNIGYFGRYHNFWGKKNLRSNRTGNDFGRRHEAPTTADGPASEIRLPTKRWKRNWRRTRAFSGRNEERKQKWK